MWLEIYKSQSPYLLKKRLKMELFRFFEKFCHLNLQDKILNESFSFLIANPPQIYLRKFLILIYCQKNILNQSDYKIFGTSILTYSFTDNFLSSIAVFDWLIFCCGNLILHQKRNENDKITNFLIKNKKMPRKYM